MWCCCFDEDTKARGSRHMKEASGTWVRDERKSRAKCAKEGAEEATDVRCLCKESWNTKRSLGLVQSWWRSLWHFTEEVPQEKGWGWKWGEQEKPFLKMNFKAREEKLEEEGGLDHPMTRRETGGWSTANPEYVPLIQIPLIPKDQAKALLL